MAANMKDPRTFFSVGTPAQYEFVFSLYEEAVKLKAQQKNKKVADFLKLDKWFQGELPKRIKSRGKDAHLVHEELVQCMKWKLARGKFSPRIKDLVQMNTPRLCITETKKAFRALLKKDDLSSAIQALCNLKGVGPAMASVMLTAADPEACGFMADECLLAIPEIEGIDYTTKELLNFVDQLKSAANRLNSSGGSGWNAHRIEQTLWAHFILNENKKELLDDMPLATAEVTPSSAIAPPTENGSATDSAANADKNGGSGDGESSSDSADSSANKENVTSNSNGTSGEPRPADEEDSNTNDTTTNGDDSNTNDSMPSTVPAGAAPPSAASGNNNKSSVVLPPQEDTNDSIATSGCSGDTSPAPLGQEEDSVNTASPPQQVSDDTNDSLPQQSNQQKPVVVEAASAGGLSNGSNGAASSATPAVTPMDEDTNDSLAMSESTCDSVPEVLPAPVAAEKLITCSSSTKASAAPVIDSTTTATSTASSKDSAAIDDGDTPEPAAKKAKLDVE